MTTIAVSQSRVKNPNLNYLRLLKNHGFEVKIIDDDRFCQGHLTDEEEIGLLQGIEAVIAAGERYPSTVIESLPDLRVISRFGVGYDKVDVHAATSNNVVLTITPNSNYEAVAEHALALIMATAKDLLSRDRSMRAGTWLNQPLMPMRKSTLGIVGLGRIGRSLAVKAQAMQMKILAMEPDPDKNFVQENDIHLVDLDYLLQNSDYVSLHCALSDNTRGLIGSDKLALMKQSAVLINTARGGLVVENDLVDALKCGQIRSAGLDVFEVEPTHHDNPIHNLDNVILSPHIAGSDKLSFEDTGNEAAKNIIDLFEGSWPDEAVINKQLKGTWKW